MTTPEDKTPDDGDRPVRYRAGDSPEHVELPFWLDACIALDPPRRSNGSIRTARHSIYPVARALAAQRIRARGDEAVKLDRTALARWAGYDHARNCGWIFTYLQRIGFLEIHRHPSASGQQSDTFDVFLRPPPSYVGPRSFAELDMALRQQANGETVRLFYRRSEPNSAREEAGSDPTSAREEVGSQNRRSEPNSAREEVALSRFDLFEISEGEIEKRASEGATPPRSAGAGDAAPEEDRVDWARQLVRSLPWRAKGCTRVSTEDARRLATCFRAAVDVHGLSREDVQAYALERLAAAKSNPVAWLLGAFEPRRLPRPGFAADEPLDASPLSLPGQKAPENGPRSATEATDGPHGGHVPGEAPCVAQSRSEGSTDDETAADSGESGSSGDEMASREEVAAMLGAVRARLEQARQRRAREQRQRLREAQKDQRSGGSDGSDGVVDEVSQAG